MKAAFQLDLFAPRVPPNLEEFSCFAQRSSGLSPGQHPLKQPAWEISGANIIIVAGTGLKHCHSMCLERASFVQHDESDIMAVSVPLLLDMESLRCRKSRNQFVR